MLSGRPPVPVGKALRALLAARKRPEAGVATIEGRTSSERTATDRRGDRQRVRRARPGHPAPGRRRADDALREARQPGGRAYVYEDEGFKFDAGPDSHHRPRTASRSCSRLGGRAMADYVELLPVDPVLPALLGGWLPVRLLERLEQLDAQIAPSRTQPTWTATTASSAYSEDVFQEGYEKLGTRALPRLLEHDPGGAAADAAASLPQRLRRRVELHQGPPPAAGLQLPLAPGGRQPVRKLLHLRADPRAGAAVGRLVRPGRHGGAGAGPGHASSRTWAERAAQRPVERDPDRGTAGSPASCLPTGSERRSTRWRAMPTSSTPTATCCAATQPAARRRRVACAAARYSMSLFVIYFGLRRRHPQLAHHTMLFGPRYRELIRDIFQARTLAEDFSLYLHAPTRHRPLARARREQAFYVLSPVPHLGTAPHRLGEGGAADTATGILDYLEKRYIPNLRERPRHHADLHAARLPERCSTPTSGRPSRWSRS